MATLDTNFLVRLLVGDDRRQMAAAKAYVKSSTSTGELLFLPLSVVFELEWVLRSRYGFDKQTIIGTFIKLLEAREIEFQEEASIEHALHFYEGSNADFADCLHLASAITHSREPLVTFDQQASKLDGAEILSA